MKKASLHGMRKIIKNKDEEIVNLNSYIKRLSKGLEISEAKELRHLDLHYFILEVEKDAGVAQRYKEWKENEEHKIKFWGEYAEKEES